MMVERKRSVADVAVQKGSAHGWLITESESSIFIYNAQAQPRLLHEA